MGHRKCKRRRDDRQLTVQAVCAALVIIIFLSVAYGVGRMLETKNVLQQRGELASHFEEAVIVTYQGQRYQARPKLTTVLFIGVDKTSETEANESRDGGQADFLLLLVIDEEQKKITPIQIDRDTMAEITVLNVLGKASGTRRAQICLSHGFGNTQKQSAELTVDAVSKLLLGSAIDFYITINLDGIPVLNDIVDGIEVTLEHDFTALEPSMRKGETLTLRGKQAEYYVRARWGIGVGTNESRMMRQREYLSLLGAALDARIQDNQNFAGTLFDVLVPYLETNMKRGRMVNEAWNTRAFTRTEIQYLEGTHSYGPDGFVEFSVQEQSLEALIMQLFYKPVY